MTYLKSTGDIDNDVHWTPKQLRNALNFISTTKLKTNFELIAPEINSLQYSDLWPLNKVEDLYNTIKKRCRKRKAFKNLVLPKETTLDHIYRCFEDELKKLPTNDFNSLTNYEKVKGRYISFGTPEETSEEVCIIPYPKEGITVIISPTGTGKTQCVSKYIKKEDGRVLIISNSIALSRQQQLSMKENGVDLMSYQDVYEDFKNAKNKVIVFDSLLRKLKRLEENYEVIWLDECSNLISHICTSTTFSNHRSELYIYFKSLLKKSEKILITDADLEVPHLKFIEKLSKKESMIYHNVHKKEKQDIFNIVRNNPDYVIEEFIKACKDETKTVAMACDTKKKINEIQRRLKEAGVPENRLKIYTSDEGSLKNLAEGVTEEWENHGILYSPSISTGVDNQNPTDVFGIFENKSVSYEVYYQMLERSRKKNSVLISVSSLRNSPSFLSIEEADEIVDRSIKTLKCVPYGFEMLGVHVNHEDFDEETMCLQKEAYYWMTQHCKVKKEISRVFGDRKLEAYIASKGHDVRILDIKKPEKPLKKEEEVEVAGKIRKSLVEDRPIDDKYEKTMENMESRGSMLGIGVRACAYENDIYWGTISSDKGFGDHFKACKLFKSKEEILDRFKKDIKYRGILDSLKNNNTYFCHILMLEGILGITDRMNFGLEEVKCRYNDILTEGDMLNEMNLRRMVKDFGLRIGTPKFEEGECGWYSIYGILRSLYKKYFGELVENESKLVRFPCEEKAKKIACITFNRVKLGHHESLYNMRNLELPIGECLISEESE